jgi:hypothetical protein
MRMPVRALLLAGFAILCCATSALAQATTESSIRPSLLPDRLGAGAALTLALRYSGGEEGVPAPVRTIVVQLPAGLRIDLHGVRSCRAADLNRRGAAGCGSGSLLGRGHATLEVHAGSQTLPEQAAVWVFRGPNRGSSSTLEILSQGYTPLDERTISTAVLAGDHAPYGSELTVSVPPIPTLVYEPDASLTSISLTFARKGTIAVPASCPAGGFAFAAASALADGSNTTAAAIVPCP